jgi:FkbM family methyltransferase
MSRVRRYFTDALRQDLLDQHAETRSHMQLMHEHTRQDMQCRLDRLQDQIGAVRAAVIAAQEPARDEARLIYTSLLDQIHATQLQLADIVRDSHNKYAALHGHLDAFDTATHGRIDTVGSDLQSHIETLDGSLRSLLEAQNAQYRDVVAPHLAHIENYAYASARRVAVPCGDGDMLVKTEAGYVLCSGSDLSVLSTLVDTGDLERGTRLLIQGLLRPGDVFVDVGANIGMHTIAAGHAMATCGTIIAFEPFAPTCRLLEKSVWLNGMQSITRIHGCAVSAQAGSHDLFLGASSGHHSLFQHAGEDTSAHGRVTVDTVRLDDVVDPSLHVTLLKIDAEGAELDVLAGAAATLRNAPDIALIVEFGPAHLRATGQNGAAWLAAFEAFGFEYRAIDPTSGSLARRSLAQLEAETSTNLFFARPGSAPWANVKETV